MYFLLLLRIYKTKLIKILCRGPNDYTVPLMLEVKLRAVKRRELGAHRCLPARRFESLERCLICLQSNPNAAVPYSSKTNITSHRNTLRHNKNIKIPFSRTKLIGIFFAIFVYYFQENIPLLYKKSVCH